MDEKKTTRRKKPQAKKDKDTYTISGKEYKLEQVIGDIAVVRDGAGVAYVFACHDLGM